jgi:hypothetical protein
MIDKGFTKTRSDGMRWEGLKLIRQVGDFIDAEGKVRRSARRPDPEAPHTPSPPRRRRRRGLSGTTMMICPLVSLPLWKGAGTLPEAEKGGNLRHWKGWKVGRRVQRMRHARAHAQEAKHMIIYPSKGSNPSGSIKIGGVSMTYGCGNAGRVHEDPSNAGRVEFWTFDDVEERLVEAMLLWRRSPDRERAGCTSRRSGLTFAGARWFTAVGGELDFPETGPAAQVAAAHPPAGRRHERSGRMAALVPERDRRLVALAV